MFKTIDGTSALARVQEPSESVSQILVVKRPNSRTHSEEVPPILIL